MNRRVSFIGCLLLLSLTSFCQLVPSTLGQVFNYQVRDSFEYTFSEGEGINPYQSVGSILLTVDSVFLIGDTTNIRFGLWEDFIDTCSCPIFENQTIWPVPRGDWGAKGLAIDSLPQSIVNLQILRPDSPVISMFDTIGAISGLDTIFINGNYYLRQQNETQASFGNTCASARTFDEDYGVGIGLISRINGVCKPGGLWWSDTEQLVYYHKASGEIWGQALPIAGINWLAPEIINLYPNPGTDNCTLEINSPGDSLSIVVVNSLGQVVMTLPKSQYSSRINFNVTSLPAGLYFIRVSNTTCNSVIKKLVVTR